MMGAASTVRRFAKVVKCVNQCSRVGRSGVFTGEVDVFNFASSPLRLGGLGLARVPRSARHGFARGIGVSCEEVSLHGRFLNGLALVKSSGTGFTRTRKGSSDIQGSNNHWRNEAPRHATSAIVTHGIVAARQVSASAASRTVNSLIGQHGILETIRHYGRCYFELSKAPLSFFVVSTAAVGFVMGSGEVVDWMSLAWTSVGTMLTASAANTLNQILEVTNDAYMKRTMRRPLPAGRMSVLHAFSFAATAGITGIALLAWKTDVLAAELGAMNLLLYTLVYTPLKQIHYFNTWVGAVVGAIPPLMGWAAATGQVDAGSWVLASALYFWQIPHFMALAFLCRRDYMAGGYKMLSLHDVSGHRTASCALRNCVYLLPLGFLAHHWGTTSPHFGIENFVLTASIGATSLLFYMKPSRDSARRLFRTSLLYLPLVMAAMVFHRIPNSKVAPSRRTEAEILEEEDERKTRVPNEGLRTVRPLPPVAFISAAPFPFLPAPDYYQDQA